jgi:hypothetical protein
MVNRKRALKNELEYERGSSPRVVLYFVIWFTGCVCKELIDKEDELEYQGQISHSVFSRYVFIRT